MQEDSSRPAAGRPPVRKYVAKATKGVPQDRDRTRWDKWYVARAEEKANVLFSFKVEPFPEVGEDAIAKVIMVDRYGIFLQFQNENMDPSFSAWISKENIIGCRTWLA